MVEFRVQCVIRLCTDDTEVTSFYNTVDRDIELPIDIVNDMWEESRAIYRLNPWLTYTTHLQTIREAGTQARVLDWLDERALTPTEVALCTQLLLESDGSGSYPRRPEAFLSAVERDLPAAELVFDVRRSRAGPPLNMEALQVAVHPSKYSRTGRALRAMGLRSVAEWCCGDTKPGAPVTLGPGPFSACASMCPAPMATRRTIAVR